MHAVILVENHMRPIPDDVRVIQNWGVESVVAGTELVTGDVVVVEATEDALRRWLSPFKGFWKTHDPMSGKWTVHHVEA